MALAVSAMPAPTALAATKLIAAHSHLLLFRANRQGRPVSQPGGWRKQKSSSGLVDTGDSRPRGDQVERPQRRYA